MNVTNNTGPDGGRYRGSTVHWAIQTDLLPLDINFLGIWNVYAQWNLHLTDSLCSGHLHTTEKRLHCYLQQEGLANIDHMHTQEKVDSCGDTGASWLVVD